MTAAIDMPLDQLHCAMIFEAEGIPSIALADSDYSGSESDGSSAPELVSESESESYSSDEDGGEESSDQNQQPHRDRHSAQHKSRLRSAVVTAATPEVACQGQTTTGEHPKEQQAKLHRAEAMDRIKQRLKQQRATEAAMQTERSTAVPPMIVQPPMTGTTTAVVQLAVSNEDGTAPLVIRKGDALATPKKSKARTSSTHGQQQQSGEKVHPTPAAQQQSTQPHQQSLGKSKSKPERRNASKRRNRYGATSASSQDKR